MNILHIISSRGWGGAENSAAYLAKTQIEHGNNAYFFIHSFNGKLKNVLNSVNVPYFSAVDPERKNVFAIKKIIDVCRQYKIDLIHTHLATGCYLGVIAGKRLGIPVISRINTYCGYPYYALADRMLFISDDLKNYFLEDYFRTEPFLNYKPGFIENLVNGLFGFKFNRPDLDDIISKSGKAYDTIPDKFSDYNKKTEGYEGFFNIGITGRLTVEKGQQYLIEAIELLRKESEIRRDGIGSEQGQGIGMPLLAGKPIMLHIVGSGKNEKNLLKQAADKKLQNSVKFWGYQSDVRPFINMFDIAVSYTTKEVFGLNNVEYMLMKKPCVSAYSGGMPELYGDTNILIEPNNPYALKEAFKKYANAPELMKLEAERGYERAAHLFSSEKIYNDTIKEYDLAIAHTKHIKETI
ncbi:MAG: glycosyltransferase family 4 protein [Deltaproteobacteria bacterium]|nr:glycosyltransferase family 4 protein [Deltaproteobacteria bacterium]